ncbi:MAG: 2-succinyl-5-enolpyruvyl-6-hydroxy-3-cyclohexene-1-carboxylic-acid synthase [Streptosporangiaceae bacterium]
MNPATALATVLADELIRCGLREAVLAPGSRSAPLALALYDQAAAGGLRLHVRIDERSAAFCALGLAKASRRPVLVACTSGTAAAHFHAAVIEADESAVPLLVLTADRPPELRGTGASQAIDQLKLYGDAVRWFCEAGVPEARPGMAAYWRSLACRAWAAAAGTGGGAGLPGPVHVNLPLREPLVPDGTADWPEPLDGRPGGAPWTSFAASQPLPPAGLVTPSLSQPWAPSPMDATATGLTARTGGAAAAGEVELPWTERGLIVCGDGDYDAGLLVEMAETAGWPVLAEPSSGARTGPNALAAYEYLLAAPDFAAAHQPDVIICAGRPGLSRPQLALLRGVAGQGARHVVLAAGPGRWADPARTATDVAARIRLTGAPGAAGAALASPAGQASLASPAGLGSSGWLGSWRRADAAARQAADALLDSASGLTEPRLARDLAAALPAGALLWAASSQPVRDLDLHMAPRSGLRVLASRGASGIDGLSSAAIGAALAHQAAGGGPAAALLGDLAFLHDAPGLLLGPDEPRPDLCLIVVNNDGGGIFSDLEQAALAGPFERLFGTPHGTDLSLLARAAGLPYTRLERAADLPALLPGRGLRVAELSTDRASAAALRSALRQAAAAAVG